MLLDCGDGQSETYLRELQRCMREAGCTGLDAIVITHWHWDHSAGNRTLARRVPGLQVVASAHERQRTPGVTRKLQDLADSFM